MPYQLMVKTNKYLPIDIRRHSRFIINSNLKNGSSNLDEIDLFTTQFDSKKKLMESLINEGLLNAKFYDNHIAIRYNHGGYNTISDSIIYSDKKAYLDENTLERTIRILSKDNGFITKLIDEYMPKDDDKLPKDDNKRRRRPYINYNVLFELKRLLSSSNYNPTYLKYFILPYKKKISYISNIDLEDFNIDKDTLIKCLVTIFYYNEVYKREKVPGKKYNYSIKDFDDYYVFGKRKYRNLHDLALLVGNYDLQRKMEEEKEEQEEFLEAGEMVFDDKYIIPISKPKVKKRVKRPIDGQCTLEGFFE